MYAPHMEPKRKIGRPSKGDRSDFKCRIPTPSRNKLFEYAAITGETIIDLTTPVMVAWIETLDLEEARRKAAQKILDTEGARREAVQETLDVDQKVA